MIKRIQQLSPIQLIIGLFFIACIAPVIHYPLTDGDIAHWAPWAHDIANNFNFLSARSDQSHGPFLAWSTGLSMAMFGSHYLILNSINLLCGCGLIYLVYLYGSTVLKSQKIAQISAVMASASVIFVYLSRTPMYDWPAAFGFLGFVYFYPST